MVENGSGATDAIARSPANWQGNLQLEYGHQAQGTQLVRSSMQAPLKVQRPFYPEGTEVCHTVMLHTAGGVVGGDRLTVDITLHPRSHSLLTTAAAMKIYRSTGLEAQSNTRIQIAQGACLEWLPQETIVFDQAIYRQDLRVDLDVDGLWIGWDIVRFGRSARGERFTSGEWRSRTEIWQQGRPLWIDPQWVKGGSEMLTSDHGLAGCPVVGSFVIVGRSLPVELVEQVRHLWQPSDYLLLTMVGVTRLLSGLLCRYRGHSTADARRWFTSIWGLTRPLVLERSACNPRVWGI